MIITLMLIFSPLIVTETVLTISYNIQISTNGYLTFGSPNSRCCPPSSAEGVDIDYLVSPFWTNFDNGLGGIILYQAIADSDAVDALNGYISGKTGTSFGATWVLSITWFEVPAFGGSPNIVSKACT